MTCETCVEYARNLTAIGIERVDLTAYHERHGRVDSGWEPKDALHDWLEANGVFAEADRLIELGDSEHGPVMSFDDFMAMLDKWSADG